jgi:hypothetical protein
MSAIDLNSQMISYISALTGVFLVGRIRAARSYATVLAYHDRRGVQTPLSFDCSGTRWISEASILLLAPMVMLIRAF